MIYNHRNFFPLSSAYITIIQISREEPWLQIWAYLHADNSIDEE